jgi:signal peptidase II
MKKPGRIAIYFYVIAALAVALDQTVKFFIKKFELGSDIADFGFFSLVHLNNYGAGFSIMQGKSWFFIVVALVFIFLIVLFYNRIEKKMLAQSGFALFLGGTISNLADRLSYGFVIDYFDFKIWPVFNIADSAITVGAVMIIIYYLKKEMKKKR